MPSRKTLPIALALFLGLTGLMAWMAVRADALPDAAGPSSSPAANEGPTTAQPQSPAGRLLRDIVPAALHPAGGYGAPRGRRLVFDTAGTLVTTLESRVADAPAQSAGDIVLDWRSRLQLEVADRRDDELAVRLRLPDMAITPSGAVQPGAPEDLDALAREIAGAEVLVRMGTDGRTLGLRFESSMSESARQWVRTLLGAFRFVIPPEAEQLAEWESLEPDTTGTLRARYAWKGERDAERQTRELDKQRLEYLPESLPSGRAEIGGGGRAKWNPRLGWIEAAEVSERLQMESEDLGIAVTYALAGRMHLISCEDRVAVVDPSLWEGGWDPPGTPAAETAPSPEQRARWLRDQLGEATLEQLLDELAIALQTFGLDSQETYMATTRLSWLLELQPEKALELDRILLAGLLDEEVASLALVALGQAGTLPSQLVLAACIGDPLRPEVLRMAALQSAFQVPAPCPELLASIRVALEGGAPRPVAGTAILLLGKLAGPDGVPAPEQAPEQQASLLEELLAYEDAALELRLLDVWLEALGNCGDPAIVPHVSPYLTHNEPQIRAAALAALRNVDSVEAVQSLAAVAQHDLDPSLRVISLEMLGTQGSALATETVCAVATQDASEAVRMAAVQALCELQGTDVLVEHTLQTCAQQDPSSAVRELAASILAGE